MAGGWDRTRVLALAPDAPAQRTASSLATGQAWTLTGATGGAQPGGAQSGAALWGECRGSAATPYRTVVDSAGPAWKCSCPSRKLPCKHVLALMLRWADGAVTPDPDGPPEWAATWLDARAARASRAAQQAEPVSRAG